MQSFPSVARALYRIVFRGGSPQRIHYAQRNLLGAMAAFLLFACTSLRFYFQFGYLEIGLFLFLALSAIYIAAALLTRRVPRIRLRLMLQALLLILALAMLLLTLLAPITRLAPAMTIPVAIGIAGCALLGASNCLQFALATTRLRSITSIIVFSVITAVLFTILRQLLHTLYG